MQFLEKFIQIKQDTVMKRIKKTFKLLIIHQYYLRVWSEARKYAVKIFVKYIKMEIFFNKTTFAIDRTDL